MIKKQEKQPTKYARASLTELETTIEQLFVQSKEFLKDVYEMLEYIRHYNRFKEDPRYKKASFWKYIEDRFTIRRGTYEENARAFSKYPKQAMEYGAGIVTKVDRVCGRANTTKVLSEIEKAASNLKKPMTRAKIESIIQKYKRSIPEKKITAWRAMYESEVAAHNLTKATLTTAMQTINELSDQIEKLKRTAETVVNIRKLFDEQEVLERRATA